MSAIEFRDLVDDRADRLADHGVNGLRLALVSLGAGFAHVELRFWNGLHLAAILAEIGGDPTRARQVFRIQGGSRVTAGSATGQVQVTGVTAIDATRLRLRVEPIGDYSTYTIVLVWDAAQIDPFFSSIGFKFRPGCFSNDCAPALAGAPSAPASGIDYLAKDYDSFRHTLMVAMADRVPGWASTSEADLDQTLIDLFAAAADELSDYQDRVMAEAYLATTRKRVSLARHARLVDYHLHEGNQASTWLAVDVLAGAVPFTLDDQELVVRTDADATRTDATWFATRQNGLDAARRQRLDPLLNRLRLHTWGDARPALAAGSTGADLVPFEGLANQAAADALRDLVRDGAWREIAIAEALNPLTGALPGRNPRKRQLLRLIAGHGDGAAISLFDPVASAWLVRVSWRDDDALRFDYSFTTFCPARVHDVSVFYGNLLPACEGRPLTVFFHEAGSVLPTDTPTQRHRYYQRLDRRGDGADWTLAALPDDGPLAYRPPPAGVPDGETPARSTLQVRVHSASGGIDPWDEIESLVHADDSAEDGDRYMVETDERRRSVLRFGNGTNGRALPALATVEARYQIGGGASGNIGADQLVHPAPLTGALASLVTATTNPFDVVDGRDPESAEHVRRHAPEAFRARQLRAVTLADYVRRAEEVPGVARAAARYAWTGSWRTVRVAIDPAGFVALADAHSAVLWNELRQRVADHLEAVRLIGEDLELRPPRYVPLDLRIAVCADAAYWREDLRYVLQQEFSDSWTADGRRGFFHPDAWTFGKSLHRSEIEGRIARIVGIRHVVSIVMKRFNAAQPGAPGAEVLEIGSDEVVLLANDADHLERGLIRFDITGGRR